MTSGSLTPFAPGEGAAQGDQAARRVPPFGGLNSVVARIELTRVLRNRRTIAFALILPSGLFLVFGSGSHTDARVGVGNVSAYVMVSMALYGGALVGASTGATVALERSLGWSRQLRLTPLQPVAYIVLKALVALVAGTVAILGANLTGLIHGNSSMPAGVWVACGLTTLACVPTFTALGVLVGYLVPGETVMQFLGPGLALLAFLGGLFTPLSSYSPIVRDIAYWSPMYGAAEVARAPLTQELPWHAVVNAVAWPLIFVLGAAWRMSKDTARV